MEDTIRDLEKKCLGLMQKVLQISEEKCRFEEYENSQIWDSLKHMELIVLFEEAFSIKFEEDEMVEMTSLMKIIEQLRKKEKI